MTSRYWVIIAVREFEDGPVVHLSDEQSEDLAWRIARIAEIRTNRHSEGTVILVDFRSPVRVTVQRVRRLWVSLFGDVPRGVSLRVFSRDESIEELEPELDDPDEEDETFIDYDYTAPCA